jgi:hypothetical protein
MVKDDGARQVEIRQPFKAAPLSVKSAARSASFPKKPSQYRAGKKSRVFCCRPAALHFWPRLP